MQDSVKILTIGDPHIRKSSRERTFQMLEQSIDLIDSLQPDAVVVLGDTLDKHSNIDSGALTKATRFLERIAEKTLLILLIGNHDILNDSTLITSSKDAEHGFVALHRWSNTIVCDEARRFSIKNMDFIGIPYLPVGNFHKVLSQVASPEELRSRSLIGAVFSHNDFNGVRYRLDSDPISCSDVWPSDYVLNVAGHVHTKQTVASNLIFVGTGIQQSYGEDSDKSVSFFTFSRNDAQAIQAQRQEYRLSIPVLREYSIEVEEIENLLYKIKALGAGTFEAKVIIHGTAVTLKGARKWESYRQLKKIPGVNVTERASNNTHSIVESLLKDREVACDFVAVLQSKIKDDPYLIELSKRYLPQCSSQ